MVPGMGQKELELYIRWLGNALLRRWCLRRNLKAVRTQGKRIACIPVSSMLEKGTGTGLCLLTAARAAGTHSEYTGQQWEAGSKQHGGRYTGEMMDDLMSHRKECRFYSE